MQFKVNIKSYIFTVKFWEFHWRVEEFLTIVYVYYSSPPEGGSVELTKISAHRRIPLSGLSLLNKLNSNL